MLPVMAKRTVHDEAREPTFDAVAHVLSRRRSYLGHILRMQPHRMGRRYLRERNPNVAPFIPGCLLADTEFETVAEMVVAAQDRVKRADG